MTLDKSLLLTMYNQTIESFKFLISYGYILTESNKISNDEYRITYNNEKTNKIINISICNYEDVKRFFVTISIVYEPYINVNDFISFEVFLAKQNIRHTVALEGDQITDENLKMYLEHWTVLFKNYGIALIKNNKRFPHNFPEWT